MASNNGFVSKNTSLITILSSVHGRLRHEQRDKDKRDLQRALKYGRFHRGKNNDKWLIEYDGITFISDQTMTLEITAFPSPLPEVDVDFKAMEANEKMKLCLNRNLTSLLRTQLLW